MVCFASARSIDRGAVLGHAALFLGAAALLVSGCSKPEPLSLLVRRVDDDVQQRLNAPIQVSRFLVERPNAIESPPPILTLLGAQRLALQQNLTLSAAAESLPIAQLALVQAGLLTNPVLAQSSGLLFPVSPALGGAASLDANLTQQLNSVFTRDSRIDIAGAQRLQSGVDLAAQVFELAMRVEEKYREISHLDNSLAIAVRISETYGRAAESAAIRSRVGVVPIPEVNRAKVAAQDAQRVVIKLRLRRAQSTRDLNFLMGVPADSTWTTHPGAGGAITGAAPVDESVARELAARFRLDLVHARLDERVGESTIQLAEAGLIPAISAGLESAYTPGSPGSTLLGPVFSIELPIFDSHRTALESARASLRKIQKTTVALESQVAADAAASVHAVETVASDVLFYRDRIIPQQRENVRIAQAAFQFGQIDLDSLLNTLRDATAAEQAAEDANVAYDAAIVGLERATGLSIERAIQLKSEPVGAAAPQPAAGTSREIR